MLLEGILDVQMLSGSQLLCDTRGASCRARWDPTKVNDVTYTGELIPPQAPAQAAPIRITVLGSWWAALLLVCTTMMCLTSAFTAFILYVRPVLQVILCLTQDLIPGHTNSARALLIELE